MFLENMYIVVSFQEDNSVEAVPSNWYDNGYCVWPTTSQNITRLIKKHSHPDEFPHRKVQAYQMGTKTCKY